MNRYFLTGAIVAISVFTLLPLTAGAVTVGPTRLEYSTDPGKTITGEMFLQNELAEKQTFYPSFERFTENNGEKVFLNEKSDLSTWFKIASSVTLKAGESKQIPFTIAVPQNAGPGGHFAVMWWSTTPPDESGKQVSIVTRAGILVYLRVSGDIVETAEVSGFRSNSRFYFGTPIDFTFRVADTGNVDVTPSGDITVSNLFGTKKVILPVNAGGSHILPQSYKEFQATWNGPAFLFGPYKATLSLSYGEEGKIISRTYWFFAISTTFLYILLGLIVFVLIVPKIIRKYNRMIIRRAGGGF